MNSDAEPVRWNAVASLIPDLRATPLGQLADLATGTDDVVSPVVNQFVGVMDNPSHTPVLAFSSAI